MLPETGAGRHAGAPDRKSTADNSQWIAKPLWLAQALPHSLLGGQHYV